MWWSLVIAARSGSWNDDSGELHLHVLKVDMWRESHASHVVADDREMEWSDVVVSS